MGRFPVPAALGIAAGDFLVSEHFYGLNRGKQGPRTFPLQVDIVPTLGAFKHDSVGLDHGLE